MKRLSLLTLTLALALGAGAEIKMPHIFGNGMVLQQEADIKLWGKAKPNSKVTAKASWSKTPVAAKADSNGNFKLNIETPTASFTPQTLQLTDADGTVTFLDVLIGDVWVSSGQSNMEMPVKGYGSQAVEGSLGEIMNASNLAGKMRFFTVERTRSYNEEKDDCGGQWLEASPEAVADFSAIGYFFGKALQQSVDIPIGMITTNWGDTRVESWMPLDALEECVGKERAEEKHKTHWCRPSEMYCSMIAPIKGYGAKGFIWYQGESNRLDSDHYEIMLAKMVERWRQDWNDTENSMPFYYVMIAPYTYDGVDKISYPLLVESQTRALDIIPNSGMATTTDLGEARSIHPPRKMEIGQRLAALALKQTYGKGGFQPEMPRLVSYRVEDGKVILTMKNVELGMIPWSLEPIKGFEIAGEDRVFHPAKAWTSDNPRNEVKVWSDEVKDPVAVRYAFRNVIPANLSNTFGIPAAPFRTDDWPLNP